MNTHQQAVPNVNHSHVATDPGHSHTIVDQASQPAPEQTNPDSHTLDTPIERGDQTIRAVTLRKPNAGELRGTSLSSLVSLDVDALRKVLPRISSPTLTEFDVSMMDPADLVALGGIFAGFLMPKAMKANLASQTA